MTFHGGGRVPMFKSRPYFGVLAVAFLLGVVGSLLTIYFIQEDANSGDIHRGVAALSLTIVLFFLLVISAFSPYFYGPGRQGRRYKRG